MILIKFKIFLLALVDFNNSKNPSLSVHQKLKNYTASLFITHNLLSKIQKLYDVVFSKNLFVTKG